MSKIVETQNHTNEDFNAIYLLRKMFASVNTACAVVSIHPTNNKICPFLEVK